MSNNIYKLFLLSAALLQHGSGPYPGFARTPFTGGNSGIMLLGTEGRRSRKQEF